MLDFDELRAMYEEAIGYHLFHDYGELTDAYIACRKKNSISYPIFGIFATTPVQLTPMQGAFVGTVTANITIFCRPDQIEEVRINLNDTAVKLNGQTGQVDGYTYTYNTSTCYVGEELKDNILDYTIPLYQSVTYSIIEGGVSSYAVKVYIDGFQVPALSVVQTRTKTSSTYTGYDMVGRVGEQMEAYGLDITVPWLDSGIIGVLRRECASGSHGTAHAVEVDNNGDITAYMMICGNIVTTAQPPLNAGLTISLVEADQTAVKIPYWWEPFTTSGRICMYTPESGETATILWGDGTGSRATGFTWHRYAEAGTHTAYICRWMDSADFIPIQTGMDISGARLRVAINIAIPSLQDRDMVITRNGGTTVKNGRLYMVDEVTNIPIDRQHPDGFYYISMGDIFDGILSGEVIQASKILEYDRNMVYR